MYQTDMSLMERLRRNLNRLSTEHDLGAEEISERTGLSRETIQQLLEGDGNITLDTLETLLVKMSWSIADLLGIRMSEERSLSALYNAIERLDVRLTKQIKSLEGRLIPPPLTHLPAAFGSAMGDFIRAVIATTSLVDLYSLLNQPMEKKEVRRVPAFLLFPLRTSEDRIVNRYKRSRIVESLGQAHRITQNFHGYIDNAKDRIFENAREEGLFYPPDELALITAGQSSVFNRVIDLMSGNESKPAIGVSIGSKGTTISFEGAWTWFRARQSGYDAHILQSLEFSLEAFRKEVNDFLIQYGRNRVVALFGYEAIELDMQKLISNVEFLNVISCLKQMEREGEIRDLQVCFAGEIYKIMEIGDPIRFEMNKECICWIPYSEIDYLITDLKAYSRESPERFDVDLCKRNWIEKLDREIKF